MSDLVSTGGGHNHPAGCTCPFCTSTTNTEPDSVDLTPTPTKKSAFDVVADHLPAGPLTPRKLVQAALARERDARVGLEDVWISANGDPVLHHQYPGGVVISKPMSEDLAQHLQTNSPTPEHDRNDIILKAMRDSRDLDAIALAAGLRTNPRRPDAALDWTPQPTQTVIVHEPTDEHDASLECPSCGGGQIHEIDRSIRWNDAEYAGNGLFVVHEADNENQTVGYRCSSCWTWLNLPENSDIAWS